MKTFDDAVLDDNNPIVSISLMGKIVFIAILSVFVSMCLVILYDTEYGFMLFIGVPLSIGFTAGFIMKNPTKSIFHIFNKVLLIFIVITLLLILCKVEGGICIIMIAVPLYILLLFSYALGHIIRVHYSITQKPFLFSLILINPFFAGIDLSMKDGFTQHIEDKLTINADTSIVWNVLTQPVQYAEPTNFFFKYGVNYPKNMQVTAANDSLYLVCNLRNGDAALKITSLKEDTLLRFEPQQNILPIKELTVYKNINTPHSHDAYFKINYGEFMIKQLGENKTELYASTELTHHLRPYFYWNLWNRYIIHHMHKNVLQTIKQRVEAN